MRNSNDIFCILFGIAGLVGIGYAVGTHTKLSKVSERLEKGIDDIANDMEFDIPEELVNMAINKAVQTEAKKAVELTARESISELKREIHSQVFTAINNEYGNLKDSVLKEITTEAAKIDVSRVRRDVEKSAEEAALRKFNDNLDDILEKFNDSLDSTSRIYSSIRDAMTKRSDSGKEFVVRLN